MEDTADVGLKDLHDTRVVGLYAFVDGDRVYIDTHSWIIQTVSSKESGLVDMLSIF